LKDVENVCDVSSYFGRHTPLQCADPFPYLAPLEKWKAPSEVEFDDVTVHLVEAETFRIIGWFPISKKDSRN
jgi:hypothetical protein